MLTATYEKNSGCSKPDAGRKMTRSSQRQPFVIGCRTVLRQDLLHALRAVVMQRREASQYGKLWIVDEQGDQHRRFLPPPGPVEHRTRVCVGQINVVNLDKN